MPDFIVPLISAGPAFDSLKYPQETFVVQQPDVYIWWDGVCQVFLCGTPGELSDFNQDDGLRIFAYPNGGFIPTGTGPAGPHPATNITPILTPGWNKTIILVINWMHASISFGDILPFHDLQDVYYNAVYGGDPIVIRPTDTFWSDTGSPP